jgi:hypothetical protein
VTVLSAAGFQLSRHALTLPNLGETPATAAHNTNGNIWYDEANHLLKAYVNGSVKVIAMVP